MKASTLIFIWLRIILLLALSAGIFWAITHPDEIGEWEGKYKAAVTRHYIENRIP